MRILLLPLACLLLPVGVAAAPAPTPQFTADECAVWQREQSFARSVAEHDAVAFAAHVAENAAFGAGTLQPDRGRDAIAKRWAGLIKGKQVALRWYPTRVTMAPGVDDVAWSSGPSLVEVFDPKAKHRYLIGAFHSVWHKDADGAWRVLFDDGVEQRPATAEKPGNSRPDAPIAWFRRAADKPLNQGFAAHAGAARAA
jgi:ketosteroid isomerase-like protein